MPVYPTPTGEQPGGPAVAPAPQAERQIKAWHCPMHPQIVRDKPGKCPICGMDLVPVYEEAAPAPAAAAPAPGAKKERKIKYWVSPMDPGYVRDKPGKAPCGMDMVPVYEEEGGEAAAPGAIAVSPTTIQSMGVRTAKVEVRPLTHDTWTVGLVTFNERNLAVINTKVSGWVERLYINATGDPVRKGQTLLSIYSPDLVSAQDEYLLALRNLKNLEKSPYPEMVDGARRLAEASRRRLEYFDVSAAQIEDPEEHRAGKETPGPGLAGQGHRHQAHGDPRADGPGGHAAAGGGRSLHHLGGRRYLSIRTALDQGGAEGGDEPEYMPGETFAGQIDYIYPYLKRPPAPSGCACASPTRSSS